MKEPPATAAPGISYRLKLYFQYLILILADKVHIGAPLIAGSYLYFVYVVYFWFLFISIQG